MSVQILSKVNETEFNYLLSLLTKITIPKKSVTSNRKNFPPGHRAITLGIVKGRFNGITQLSYFSKKFPEVYKEICRIGDLICPHKYTSIHLNQNVICPPHKDSNNTSASVLISFGDYQGCNIVIDNIKYDAKYTPLYFNGAELEHYNTNDLVGNKYSLVFF
tara:strand:+ start:183 stop:668 length:486 start_codon:yes stop_codon:yes gene_type:complete